MDANMGLIRQARTDVKLRWTPIQIKPNTSLLRQIRRVADAIEYNKIICKFDGSGREAKAIRRKVGEPK
uniref:Uncharacterized protein n=1 Tax=Romanomermis culicivorax TaxID=13658 RepID=A0A915I9X6_ROMCU